MAFWELKKICPVVLKLTACRKCVECTLTISMYSHATFESVSALGVFLYKSTDRTNLCIFVGTTVHPQTLRGGGASADLFLHFSCSTGGIVRRRGGFRSERSKPTTLHSARAARCPAWEKRAEGQSVHAARGNCVLQRVSHFAHFYLNSLPIFDFYNPCDHFLPIDSYMNKLVPVITCAINRCFLTSLVFYLLEIIEKLQRLITHIHIHKWVSSIMLHCAILT